MHTRLHERFKRTLIGGLFASLSCMHGIAGAIQEAEPNDTQPQAQVLSVPAAGLQVAAAMGMVGIPSTTDLDIYAFQATAGDVPTIMVVSDDSWDAFLLLYDSVGNILQMNDDANPVNPANVSSLAGSTLDSRIDTYNIPSDGTYYIAVTPVPRYLQTNFTLAPAFPPPVGNSGVYDLLVSGLTPVVTTGQQDPVDDEEMAEEEESEDGNSGDDQMAEEEESEDEGSGDSATTTGGDDIDIDDTRIVTIQIKRYDRKVSTKGKKSKGKKSKGKKAKGKNRGIPVAIMSSPDFDATRIDKHNLTFGAIGNEASLMKCRKKGKDVKVDKVKDGRDDMICYFNPDVAGFMVGDVSGTIRGTWVNEGGVTEQFEGSAALSVLIVSTKKGESWHVRHGVDPHDKKYKRKKAKRSKHDKHSKHGKKHEHDKHSRLD